MTRQTPISRLVARAFALLAAVSGPALALDPSQVFEKVSPSVWVVRTRDAAERPLGLGSAVVVAHGKLVTNCHVLVKAKYVNVRRKNVSYGASLEDADVRRDLCLLKVDNFDAPPVATRARADLKVGERVFAIGNPEGLEVTLSEGLISGLRSMSGALAAQGVDEVIQTTAPISPGSSGGGLFDAEGRLIGITTLYSPFAQNLNIALPADWIAQIHERSQAALAKQSTPRAPIAAPGLPAAGTSWKYRVVERIFSGKQLDVTVRVLHVDGAVVEERLTSSAGGGKDARRSVDARASRFFEFALDSDDDLIELSPYLLAINAGRAPTDIDVPVGYPSGGGGLPDWVITLKDRRSEDVTVPAGTFRTLRLDLAGRRTSGAHMPGRAIEGRFEMTVWYAPEVKRFVKLVRKVWSAAAFNPSQIGENVVELLDYRPPS
jgi:S1-C subfamily serine protease